MSAVSSIRIAALRERLRDSATIGVEQNKPICTPGVAKRAAAPATARSQEATSWQPAAVATPSTAAITGWGRAGIAIITPEHSANRSSNASAPRSLSAR
ncbi:hypothetical protein CHKEEEPN_2226 [Methylorubrum podarium]|nr:hypothetical protein CHKEEEPN_2226 [Methylorubrum podarium]